MKYTNMFNDTMDPSQMEGRKYRFIGVLINMIAASHMHERIGGLRDWENSMPFRQLKPSRGDVEYMLRVLTLS